MQSMSLQGTNEDEEVHGFRSDQTVPRPSKALATPVRPPPGPSRRLPSLNSAEWETEDLPPPPPRVTKTPTKGKLA